MVTANDTPELSAGHYYELCEDINVIPRGVYRLEDQNGECLAFSVGKEIAFYIAGHWAGKVRRLTDTQALIRRTGKANFLERYRILLEEYRSRGAPYDPSKPLTGCFMPPGLIEELER